MQPRLFIHEKIDPTNLSTDPNKRKLQKALLSKLFSLTKTIKFINKLFRRYPYSTKESLDNLQTAVNCDVIGKQSFQTLRIALEKCQSVLHNLTLKLSVIGIYNDQGYLTSEGIILTTFYDNFYMIVDNISQAIDTGRFDEEFASQYQIEIDGLTSLFGMTDNNITKFHPDIENISKFPIEYKEDAHLFIKADSNYYVYLNDEQTQMPQLYQMSIDQHDLYYRKNHNRDGFCYEITTESCKIYTRDGNGKIILLCGKISASGNFKRYLINTRYPYLLKEIGLILDPTTGKALLPQEIAVLPHFWALKGKNGSVLRDRNTRFFVMREVGDETVSDLNIHHATSNIGGSPKNLLMLQWLLRIALGYQYELWNRNLIHEDLKPSNIRITIDHKNQRIIISNVIDVADVIENNTEDLPFGTPPYLAFELVQGVYDHYVKKNKYNVKFQMSSDISSLGFGFAQLLGVKLTLLFPYDKKFLQPHEHKVYVNNVLQSLDVKLKNDFNFTANESKVLYDLIASMLSEELDDRANIQDIIATLEKLYLQRLAGQLKAKLGDTESSFEIFNAHRQGMDFFCRTAENCVPCKDDRVIYTRDQYPRQPRSDYFSDSCEEVLKILKKKLATFKQTDKTRAAFIQESGITCISENSLDILKEAEKIYDDFIIERNHLLDLFHMSAGIANINEEVAAVFEPLYNLNQIRDCIDKALYKENNHEPSFESMTYLTKVYHDTYQTYEHLVDELLLLYTNQALTITKANWITVLDNLQQDSLIKADLYYQVDKVFMKDIQDLQDIILSTTSTDDLILELSNLAQHCEYAFNSKKAQKELLHLINEFLRPLESNDSLEL